MRQWSFIETHPQEIVKNKMSNIIVRGGGGGSGIFPRCLNTGFNFTVYVTGQN